MKLKDEIKIKGSASEVVDQLTRFIKALEEKNCDRFLLNIKSKAWNVEERAAHKAAKSRARAADTGET